MGVKVYISGISGNKEVKKRQQRVLMILESRNVKYSAVDITEPGRESDRDFMQEHSTSLGATVSDTNPRHPLPPQLFNDDQYCGDYDEFDMANEVDELEKFLKLAPSDDVKVSNAEITFGNGIAEPESTEQTVDSTEQTEPINNKNSTTTNKLSESESEMDHHVGSSDAKVESSHLPEDGDENDGNIDDDV